MISQDIDVAVIGGGPAGLAAAIKAKEAGLDKVFIIERGEYLGGLLDQCIHNGFGLFYFNEDLTGPEYGQRFIEKANDLGVESLLETMVVRLFPDRKMAISNDKGFTYLSPKAIILAMGCRERSRESLSIPGTRPAGSSAANFAMGKAITKNPKISLRAGENIRCIVPQSITAGQEVTLSMRVKEPAEKVRVKVGDILTKGLRAVKPSEMVKLTISSKEWSKMTDEVNEFVVSCESGR